MSYLYDHLINPENSFKKRFNYPQIFFRNLSREMAFNYSLIRKKPSEIKLLDLGMGWGQWANMAKGFGGQVFVAEISEERKLMAKEMGLGVTDINNTDLKFDFVNLDQVLEHLANPEEVIKKISSLMCTKGIIKIEVPNGKDQIKSLLNKNWKPKKDSLHPLEHINSFSPSSLIKSFSIIGFKPISFFDILNTSRIKSFIYLFKKYYNQHLTTTIYFKKI
jgi:2-polyprenyl-3-methyl-5-hydroxy-6-metoxy-1,4-benzoquinol methylase